MLLSVCEPRTLLLFPGIPGSWRSCAFEGLTTPLGWTVPARLEAGKVSFVKAWRTYPEVPEVTIRSEFPLGEIEGDLRVSDKGYGRLPVLDQQSGADLISNSWMTGRIFSSS